MGETEWVRSTGAASGGARSLLQCQCTAPPTPAPSVAPTTAPTAAPTPAPTAAPTAAPTSGGLDRAVGGSDRRLRRRLQQAAPHGVVVSFQVDVAPSADDAAARAARDVAASLDALPGDPALMQALVGAGLRDTAPGLRGTGAAPNSPPVTADMPIEVELAVPSGSGDDIVSVVQKLVAGSGTSGGNGTNATEGVNAIERALEDALRRIDIRNVDLAVEINLVPPPPSPPPPPPNPPPPPAPSDSGLDTRVLIVIIVAIAVLLCACCFCLCVVCMELHERRKPTPEVIPDPDTEEEQRRRQNWKSGCFIEDVFVCPDGTVDVYPPGKYLLGKSSYAQYAEAMEKGMPLAKALQLLSDPPIYTADGQVVPTAIPETAARRMSMFDHRMSIGRYQAGMQENLAVLRRVATGGGGSRQDDFISLSEFYVPPVAPPASLTRAANPRRASMGTSQSTRTRERRPGRRASLTVELNTVAGKMLEALINQEAEGPDPGASREDGLTLAIPDAANARGMSARDEYRHYVKYAALASEGGDAPPGGERIAARAAVAASAGAPPQAPRSVIPERVRDGVVYTIRVTAAGHVDPEGVGFEISVEREGGEGWWTPALSSDRTRFGAAPQWRYGPLVCDGDLGSPRQLKVLQTRGDEGFVLEKIELTRIRDDHTVVFEYGGFMRPAAQSLREESVLHIRRGDAPSPAPAPVKGGYMYMVYVRTEGEVPQGVALMVSVEKPRHGHGSSRWWTPELPAARVRFDGQQPLFRFGPLSCPELLAPGPHRVRIRATGGEGEGGEGGVEGFVLARMEVAAVAGGAEPAVFEHGAGVPIDGSTVELLGPGAEAAAATRIQASFRGMKTRRELLEELERGSAYGGEAEEAAEDAEGEGEGEGMGYREGDVAGIDEEDEEGPGHLYQIRIHTAEGEELPKDTRVEVAVERPGGGWWTPSLPATGWRFDRRQPRFRFGPLPSAAPLGRPGRVRARLVGPGCVTFTKVEVVEVATDTTTVLEHDAEVSNASWTYLPPPPGPSETLSLAEEASAKELAWDPPPAEHYYMVRLFTGARVPAGTSVSVRFEVQGGGWWAPRVSRTKTRFDSEQPLFRLGPLASPQRVDDPPRMLVEAAGPPGRWILKRVQLEHVSSGQRSDFDYQGWVENGAAPLELVRGEYGFDEGLAATKVQAAYRGRLARQELAAAPPPPPPPPAAGAGADVAMYGFRVYTGGVVPDVKFSIHLLGESGEWWRPKMQRVGFVYEGEQPRFRFGPLTCPFDLGGVKEAVLVPEGGAGGSAGRWVVKKVEVISKAGEVTRLPYGGYVEADPVRLVAGQAHPAADEDLAAARIQAAYKGKVARQGYAGGGGY